MDLAHYKVILSYNGLDFAGFQRQKEVRTVQGEFEACLRELDWQGGSILAAGRTDAGVHASGQVVSFWLDWRHSPEDLRSALNYYLPRDMAVQAVTIESQDFHPRFDAKKRCYVYNFFCQQIRDPIREAYAWRVWPGIDLDKMKSASSLLIGSHDFKAFGSPTSENGITFREVFSINWHQQRDEYQFEICGNAFLYHMVRRIIFLLVKIGQGEASEDLIQTCLATGKMPITGLAPAYGLVLKEVSY